MKRYLHQILCGITLCVVSHAYAQEVLLPVETIVEPRLPTPSETIAPLDNISVQSTRVLTHESIGISSAASLGFSSNIWQGSSTDTLALLLESLPKGIKNHRFRDLLSLLLTLSSPEPSKSVTPEGKPHRDWLFTRANALISMGRTHDASKLLSIASSSLPERLKARAMTKRAAISFIENNQKAGCALLNNFPLQARISEAYAAWPVICDYVNDETDKMDLKLGLLRETETLPAWLPEWLEAMETLSPKASEKEASIFEDTHQLPFYKLSLLRTLFPAYWPRDYRSLARIETLPLPLQNAIATDPRLATMLNETEHLKLKELLFLKGSLSRETLYSAYANATLSSFKKDTPLTSTTAFRGAEGRAALYQRLVRTVDLAEQSDILNAFFTAAVREGYGTFSHRLFQPLLAEMANALHSNTPSLHVAPMGYLNAAYHQDKEALQKWHTHLAAHQPTYIGLPFYRVFRELTTPREKGVPLPRPTFSAGTLSGTPQRAKQAMDLLALVEDEKAALSSATGGYQLQPDINALGALLPLRNAVRRDATGEVVVRIIALLEQPRPNLSPTVAAAAVRALNHIGYHSWADLLLTQQLAQQLQ